MGTEISRLGGFGFRGTITAGGDSNQKGGKIGANNVNLRKTRKGSRGRWDAKRNARIQLETSRTSGFRLGTTRHPCDKVMKRWVGEGGKATLVKALDADIFLEAIKEL